MVDIAVIVVVLQERVFLPGLQLLLDNFVPDLGHRVATLIWYQTISDKFVRVALLGWLSDLDFKWLTAVDIVHVLSATDFLTLGDRVTSLLVFVRDGIV